MSIEEWEKREDGSLRLLPLVDARVAKSPLQVFVRLQFAQLQKDGKEPEVRHLQLGMTPAQSQQLARALLEAADRIDRTGLGTT